MKTLFRVISLLQEAWHASHEISLYTYVHTQPHKHRVMEVETMLLSPPTPNGCLKGLMGRKIVTDDLSIFPTVWALAI